MPPSYSRRIYIIFSGAIFFLILWSLTAPDGFPEGKVITVSEGTGLHGIGTLLEKEYIIRSPVWFRIFSTLLGGDRSMKAGEYYFGTAQTLPMVVWRISRGDWDIDTVKITVPEGFTVEKISKLFDERFPLFDNKVFETFAPEGYLFPDTYFMLVTATATSTVKVMHDNFVRQIFDLMPEVELSGRSLEDTIVIASLLEGEAKTKLDREIISGIIAKRLKLGMPLQIDSEMGTYEFVGLPDKPINNPGLVSISAAIHPTMTAYLYFLTGKDGKMHYAKTFDEHKANIAKYLPN